MTINKKSFCGAPWHILRVKSRGNFAVCCQHKQTSESELYVTDTTIEEWRNSDFMRDLRQEYLDGKFPEECSRCYIEEESGKLTIRNKVNANYVKWDQLDSYTADKPENLREIQIDLGNLCNLKCMTCRPNLSTQVLQDWKKLDWMQDKKIHGAQNIIDMTRAHLDFYMDDRFLDSFRKNIHGVTNLRFLGGEPFMNPKICDFIDAVPKDQAAGMTLLITTNGTVWNDELLEKASKFKTILLNISMDGTESLIEYIRKNTAWEKMAENVDRYMTLPKHFSFSVVLTSSVYNVINTGDITRYIRQRWARPKIVINRVFHPEYLSPANLPDDLKELALDNIEQEKRQRSEYPHMIWLRTELSSLAKQIKQTEFDEDKWNQMIDYTNKLDNLRSVSFPKLVPAFAKYFNKS
jgi:wyosine [tRNA(Phe)-imidazoG37] synthetase (radical SAM superfamily)